MLQLFDSIDSQRKSIMRGTWSIKNGEERGMVKECDKLLRDEMKMKTFIEETMEDISEAKIEMMSK